MDFNLLLIHIIHADFKTTLIHIIPLDFKHLMIHILFFGFQDYIDYFDSYPEAGFQFQYDS